VFALAAAVVEHAFGGDREPFQRQLIKAIAAEPGRPYRESWTAALGQRFCAAFLQRRRDALAVILDRAKARGELPAGVSAGTITDIVFGVIWYRMLATRQPLDDKLATELVSALTGPPPGQDPLTISRRKRT